MAILAFKMPARVASRSRTSTKGRGGRKGGPERRGSGPERRRVLKPQNYSTTPAIKAWRPPVPEPLPPAPLLSPAYLLGLGALALAQAWAWINSRPKTSVDVLPAPGLAASGIVPPEGGTTPGTLTVSHAGISYDVKVNCTGTQITNTLSANNFTASNVIGATIETTNETQCGYQALRVRAKRLNQADLLVNIFSTNIPNGVGWIAARVNLVFNWTGPNGVLWAWPQDQIGSPAGYTQPVITPSEAAEATTPQLPVLPPLPLPSTEPEVEPEVAPVTPDTSTIPLPQPVRTTTTVTTQQKLPGAITTENGALPDATPSPVPTTDPTAIVPWPGASPIPGPGPSPAPTLEGIAQEVGRIERKLEIMNTPGAPGNMVDNIGNIGDLVGQIVSAILALGSGTQYTLDSPCEVDEATGEKLPPVVVEVPGALTQFGALTNRLDALAELIQVHKNLRQPNCKPKQPTGEFVTVNFEQID